MDRNGWQRAPLTQSVFWWNRLGLILTKSCYTSQIIKIFVWLAVYFGLFSCTSNAFEKTQNASTGMLDSITPIFLGMCRSFGGIHDSLQTIEILFLFVAYFGFFSCTSNAFEKTQNAGARWESQGGCIFSQLQTSVARQSAFLGTVMTKTQFSRPGNQ